MAPDPCTDLSFSDPSIDIVFPRGESILLRRTDLKTHLKVCCIESVEEARLAARYGASAVGLVSAMPSGPGVIDASRIAEIARLVPPGVARFLLTSRTDKAGIVAQQRTCGVDTLQLCDRVPSHLHGELREALPGVRIVQVVHVADHDALGEAQRAAETADALLLDSGRPDAERRELGGTGRTHDWKLSRKVREAVLVPLFLAGGIRVENIARAIEAVGPYGIDVCSGLRSNGRLDEAKLSAFVEEMDRAS